MKAAGRVVVVADVVAERPAGLPEPPVPHPRAAAPVRWRQRSVRINYSLSARRAVVALRAALLLALLLVRHRAVARVVRAAAAAWAEWATIPALTPC